MAQNSGKSYTIDMCSGPILPKLLRFTIPLMCSTMLQLLFNAADTVVVGRYAGDNSLAAVGSTSVLIALLTNLFLGFSIGANILAAGYFGSKDNERLEQTVHTSILLSLISGLFLTVIGVIGAREVLIWMQTPPAVLDLATLYLRIYFLGMPATMLYNFGAALLRSIGDTRRPLYFLFAAGIVNVILNLIFVIVFNLDVAGVAIATVISQCISAALVIRCLMRESGGIHLDLRRLRIVRPRLVQIVRVGLPAGIQSSLFSLSNVVIQSSINSFGEIVMAGNSAARSIGDFPYAAVNAFYQANAAFTSQNYGAGNYRRIGKIFWVVQGCAAVVASFTGVFAVVFGPQLLGIYSHSPEVVAAGMVRLRYVLGIFYCFCGLMDSIVGSLRGIGYNIMPMIVTLLGSCAFRLLWLATVFQIPEYHTIEVVFMSYPVSWVVTWVVHIICFFWAYRRLLRTHEEPPPQAAPES